ncbi:hypothetical protein QYE76_003925 [Lolium multiflorum]|uniref:Uncharacterized protein n=1 Tax=Lolium multiflorum TaxID=4521 RepID=A0AAD8VZA4_LOLMU|nr:hypothetical protein QYE76_003925 [Lolium multiflorum]
MESSIGKLSFAILCVDKAWCIHLPISSGMFDSMLETIHHFHFTSGEPLCSSQSTYPSWKIIKFSQSQFPGTIAIEIVPVARLRLLSTFVSPFCMSLLFLSFPDTVLDWSYLNHDVQPVNWHLCFHGELFLCTDSLTRT